MWNSWRDVGVGVVHYFDWGEELLGKGHWIGLYLDLIELHLGKTSDEKSR